MVPMLYEIKICWSMVCNEDPDTALDIFMKLLNPVTNKHARLLFFLL
jgi:hypothetical protein